MLSCSTKEQRAGSRSRHRAPVAKHQQVCDLDASLCSAATAVAPVHSRDRGPESIRGRGLNSCRRRTFRLRAVPSDDRQLEEEARSGRNDDGERDTRPAVFVPRHWAWASPKVSSTPLSLPILAPIQSATARDSKASAPIGTQNAATIVPPPRIQVEAAATKGSTRASASDVRTKRMNAGITRSILGETGRSEPAEAA